MSDSDGEGETQLAVARRFPALPAEIAMMTMVENSVACIARNSLVLRSIYAGGEPTEKEMEAVGCGATGDGIMNGKKKGKRKRSTDETPKKRGKSGFQMFCAEQFKQSATPSGTPKRKLGEIQKENAARWKLLSEEDKADWKQRAEEQKAQSA